MWISDSAYQACAYQEGVSLLLAYLLDRLDYRADPAFAGRADPNPMHFPAAAQ
jgi:hypothetical protein